MKINTSPMIEISEVSKVYKIYNNPIDRLKESLSFTSKPYHEEFYALNNVSFSIEKGETIGILGKNGSGKSTLLKIITGVLMPSSGSVKVKGRVSALLELGAGFNLEYTGLENIYLNGTIMGFSKEEMNKKVDSIVEFAEIGEFITQPVKMYSSGMFARLAFALAINVEPDILIVDEALAVGDIRFQAKCFDKFKDLKKQGVTILFVSHDVQSIRNFCDRAVWLDRGIMKSLGDTVEISSQYIEYMNKQDNEQTAYIASNNSKLSARIDKKTSQKTLMNPIKRWGEVPTLIQDVQLLDSTDTPTNVIQYGEAVKIQVIFFVPEHLDSNTLSVACSIKDIKGIDIFVTTTFDDSIMRIDKKECYYEAVFEFTNYINSGDYTLVVAIEDRSQSLPKYYDFIEGASYFKIVTNSQRFGLFSLPTRKSINLLGVDENE